MALESYQIAIIVVVPLVIILPLFAPFLLILVNLFSSLCFFIHKSIYKRRYRSIDKRNFWKNPVKILARFWNIVGKLYHGYEIVGIEKIPQNGPAILILYHGYVPIDAPFFLSKVYIDIGRKIVTIIDRMATKIPGYQTFLEALEHTPGSIESCVETLTNDDLLLVYPGGTREAFMADNYDVLWRDNTGFAKIALQTNAPIIPMFTQNVREVFYNSKLFLDHRRGVYLKTKQFYPLFYGWFPIRMRTFVGDPIKYERSDSVEEVVSKTRNELEKLIKRRQRVPNGVFNSMLDRFRSPLDNEKIETL